MRMRARMGAPALAPQGRRLEGLAAELAAAGISHGQVGEAPLYRARMALSSRYRCEYA